MTMIAPGDDHLVGADASALTTAACLFGSFGDRSRLTIVQMLLVDEHRVVDLVGPLGLAQSTVSKHLACLVDCGIAQVRTQGRASFYSLAHREATLELLSAAETLLALTGDAIELCPAYGADATSGTSR